MFVTCRRNCGLYPSATFVTDKAPTYPALIQAMEEHAYFNQPVEHINRKGCNNRIESDHAALKRIINSCKGFKTLRTAKATLLAIEAVRTIKRGDVFEPVPNVKAAARLVNQFFGIAA